MFNNKKRLVKLLIGTFPAYPNKNDYSLSEIFKQEEYTKANSEKQNEIKLKSAKFRYDYESEHCLIEK